MGQCLSAHQPGSTPERFKGRWTQQGGLGDGLAAFDAKYGGGLGAESAKPAYTTTADVGLKAREDSKQFAFLNDKPPPLQLERIEEDAALQAGPEASPLKPLPGLGLDGLTTGGAPLPGGDAGGHPQRKPISWTKGELVGQGAYGSVFVAMDNDTGELIAVKQVHVPRGAANSKKVEENLRSLEEEVQLLQQFDHPNIVRYLGTEKTEDALHIMLEYVPGGSIASLLAKFGSFKESVIKVYTKQILLGLEYLHSKGVMHRDIKGANILVDNTGLVKLADFGASKKLEDLVTVADGNKSVRGTPYWMAPEVITQTGHGRQADLWSVACTVLEMATGRPPWSTQYPSQVAAMFHIASSKGPPEIPQHLSPECKDFLYLCFNRDWKARPAASTLLRHPFLADVVVRSQAGPSPNAVALAHVWRTQQPAGRGASGSAAGLEGSDGQFGTPSPLHPKVAAAQAGLAGGAARISLQADTTEGDGTVALSPLGAHAATKQQWDSAAAPQQQQPQRRQGAFPAAPQPGGRAYSGSPVKRPAMSLRASAPAFSGYASVALSQQPEQLSPPLVRPPAPQQPMGSGQLRNSRDSGSTALHSTAVAHTASQELPRSGSQQQLAQEASAATLSPLEDEPAAELEAPAEEVAAGVSKTPAVERQRPGVQDLMAAEPSGAAGTSPGTADSAGNSSGTHKSDYNPMEEPSWLHPAESPLAGEGTPTSALTTATGGPAASIDQRVPTDGQEVASHAPEGGAALPPEAVAPAAEDSDGPAAEPAPASELPELPFGSHRSGDHMVWTNEDGDIDALPWDMGGWSTGSSSERQQQHRQQQQQQSSAPAADEGQEQRQPGDPVDEDALIGALRRKAQHDMRASLALFEKSLNIPALHAPPLSPKAPHAPLLSPGTSRGGIAAARDALPALAVPLPPDAEPGDQLLSAESIEGRGGMPSPSRGPLSSRHGRRQPFAASLAAAPSVSAALVPAAVAMPVAAGDDSQRHLASVQHVLAGVRQTASGVLPPPAPLATAVGGLAGLGYGGGGPGAAGGPDREAVWQQELSQELFRVKASTAVLERPHRRASMHGSPLKRGL